MESPFSALLRLKLKSEIQQIIDSFMVRVRPGTPTEKARFVSNLPPGEQTALLRCECLVAHRWGKVTGIMFYCYRYYIQEGTVLVVEKTIAP